jgi:hypothetical protein
LLQFCSRQEVALVRFSFRAKVEISLFTKVSSLATRHIQKQIRLWVLKTSIARIWQAMESLMKNQVPQQSFKHHQCEPTANAAKASR